MQKTILFKNPFILFIVMLLFTASCNNNDSAAVKTDEENTTDKTTTPNVTTMATDLSGNLDTLWIDATTFQNLGNGTRLTFRFYIQSPTALTLHGWTGNSNSWDDKPPAVKLSVGRQSIKPAVPYGTGSYFGNLEITPSDFNKIVQKINSKTPAYKFVVFGPVNPTSGTEAGEIYYKIYVSDDDPSFTNINYIHKFSVIDADADANPSPPRNSGN